MPTKMFLAVVGAVGLLALVATTTGCLFCHKRRRSALSGLALDHVETNNHEPVKPSQLHRSDIVVTNEALQAGSFGDVVLGKVAFHALHKSHSGLVAVAAHGPPSTTLSRDCPLVFISVMVKVMERAAVPSHVLEDTLCRASQLVALNSPHILKVLGVCDGHTEPRVLVALEPCVFGPLPQYLRLHGDNASHRLVIATDVARAMQYLDSLRLIHGGIAARNVLINGQRLAKLSDGGIGRHFSALDQQCCTRARCGNESRWASPELLSGACVSAASDIWAFGVFLFELESCATTPYDNLSDDMVAAAVLLGLRLSSPQEMPVNVAHLMERCFHDPSTRPDATTLVRALLAAEFVTVDAFRGVFAAVLNLKSKAPVETPPLLPLDALSPIVLLKIPVAEGGYFLITEQQEWSTEMLCDFEDSLDDGFNPLFPTMDLSHHNHARPSKDDTARRQHHRHRHHHHHHHHHYQHHNQHHQLLVHLSSQPTDGDHGDSSSGSELKAFRPPLSDTSAIALDMDDENEDHADVAGVAHSAVNVDVNDVAAAFAELDAELGDEMASRRSHSQTGSSSDSDSASVSPFESDTLDGHATRAPGGLFPGVLDGNGHLVAHDAEVPASAQGQCDALRNTMLAMISDVLQQSVFTGSEAGGSDSDGISSQGPTDLCGDCDSSNFSRKSTYDNDYRLHRLADKHGPKGVKELFTDNVFDAILEGDGGDHSSQFSRMSSYDNDYRLHRVSGAADASQPPAWNSNVGESGVSTKELFTDNVFDAILEGDGDESVDGSENDDASGNGVDDNGDSDVVDADIVFGATLDPIEMDRLWAAATASSIEFAGSSGGDEDRDHDDHDDQDGGYLMIGDEIVTAVDEI